jgi:predicted DNA-binding protein (MmcQ/YjbR family)
MINPDEIITYCLSKPFSYVDYPFGYIPVCLRIRAGSKTPIFAQLYPAEEDRKITLKCGPESAIYYRQLYPGTVVRGYYCPPSQQPYWNTVYLYGGVPDDELKQMIDMSYDIAIAKLPKYIKKELGMLY